jgi:hypothetical protein
MNRWRQRHPSHPSYVKPAKKDNTYGELTDDSEVSEAAGSVYSEAVKHRAGVIARDKAAKARKKKSARSRG